MGSWFSSLLDVMSHRLRLSLNMRIEYGLSESCLYGKPMFVDREIGVTFVVDSGCILAARTCLEFGRFKRLPDFGDPPVSFESSRLGDFSVLTFSLKSYFACSSSAIFFFSSSIVIHERPHRR